MIQNIFISGAILTLFVGGVAHASSLREYVTSVIEAQQSARTYQDITVPSIRIPSVVELAVKQSKNGFLLLNTTHPEDKSPEPYLYQEDAPRGASVSASSDDVFPSAEYLVDGDVQTTGEFSIDDESGEVRTARIILSYDRPILASELSLTLDTYVALPTYVAISTGDGIHALVKTRMTKDHITFPRTPADTWIITFWHVQPLRIAEIHLRQEGMEETQEGTLRFLAQPQNTYRLYTNMQHPVFVPLGERADMTADSNVLTGTLSAQRQNPLYIPADVDGDGVRDAYDNCVYTPNPLQEDIDENGRGDACDDFDKDGVQNADDNCMDIPNRQQYDEDGDGIGDVCDTEESRITEKYSWLPLLAMIVVFLTLVTLMGIVARSMRREQREE